MVSSRTSSAYKYTGKESSKICDTFILQKQKGSSSPSTYGQSSSISLFGKNGRDKKRTHDSGDKWNMGILFSKSDYSYCRIPVGGLKTRAAKAFREMKNSSSKWILNNPIVQELIQSLGPVDVDLFASKLCHQIPRYRSWQPGVNCRCKLYDRNFINFFQKD